MRPFLETPSSRLKFVRSVRDLERLDLQADARLVIWERDKEDEAKKFAHPRGIPVWRMEGGFLRSVGLGSAICVGHCSLVLDKRGIYYGPASPSELEH